MQKELSIVRVDTRHYRVIARENWGLTPEQMKGKHVHHRIAVSDGGTNDPANLYVCDPWFHKNVWHAEDSYNSLIPYAEIGGQKAYAEKKGIHGLSPMEHRKNAVNGGNAGGWKKSQEQGIGIFGDRSDWKETYIENGRRNLQTNIEKNPSHQSESGKKGGLAARAKGVGIHAPGIAAKAGKISGKIAVESGQLARARTPESIRKGAIAGGNSKWSDPDHPEIGIHNAGVLVRKQMALGLPHGKENRVKVG